MDDRSPLSPVRRYHEATKHHPHRFAPGPGYMDWANQPDPFRRFAGAELKPLPLVDGTDRLTYEDLFMPSPGSGAPVDQSSLGLFLELALGLSAWKEFQGTRWALRNNPSSGNLHPTEGYVVILREVNDAPAPGLYHYAPREQALECRYLLPDALARALSQHFAGAPLIVGLTSIHWREAWKYGERAYRYCQLDLGHALGTLRFSARVLGWRTRLLWGAADRDIESLLGLNRTMDFDNAEPEHPDCLLAVNPEGNPDGVGSLPSGIVESLETLNWRGQANRLSEVHMSYPGIADAENAFAKPFLDVSNGSLTDGWSYQEEQPSTEQVAATTIIRQRRSAVDMDGSSAISRGGFLRMMSRVMPDPVRPPWDGFPFTATIHLLLFVHRVEGMAPGLYLLARQPTRQQVFHNACTSESLSWEPVSDCALPLIRLAGPVDVQDVAGQISCGQAIASDGAFSLGMISDFDATIEQEGSWAYRRLFWEAGLIGQILYLEAEAQGVRGTGIGCFFDDLDHQILGVDPAGPWQSVYHFTVGGSIEDDRLSTLPAYSTRFQG